MQELSFDDIFGGYVKDKINIELKKIYENIIDKRIDKNVKRELNVRMVFEPSGDESRILIRPIKVSSKFTPKKDR